MEDLWVLQWEVQEEAWVQLDLHREIQALLVLDHQVLQLAWVAEDLVCQVVGDLWVLQWEVQEEAWMLD